MGLGKERKMIGEGKKKGRREEWGRQAGGGCFHVKLPLYRPGGSWALPSHRLWISNVVPRTGSGLGFTEAFAMV